MEKVLTKQDILDLFARSDKRFEKRINKVEKMFTGQWGKLIESLIEGDLVNLLKQRGVNVEYTATRLKRKYNGRHVEIDIVAVNTTEIVAVEVKTTLLPDDVKNFLEELQIFKEVFPEYKKKRLYGAVAYLKVESEADVYSERKGLFMIRATGNSASITNDEKFKPKAF